MWWDDNPAFTPELKTAMLAMRDNPVMFAENMLGMKLRKWQRVFLTNIANHEMVTVRSANGVGKTWSIAIAIIWGIVFFDNIKIALISTTAGQASRTGWSDVMQLFYRLPKIIQENFEVGKGKIYPHAAPWNTAEIVTAAKDAPTTIQGIHCENPWAFVDEASGVEEFIFNMLIGILTDPNPRLILTGNPNYNSGYFYESFNKNREEFVTMKVSRFDILEDLTQERERIAFKRFIDKVKSLHGEESNEYRIRVLGEFPIDDDDSVISRYQVNRALKRFHLNRTTPAFTPVIWGVDPALFGSDTSQLAKRQGPVLLETIKTIPKVDLMQQAYWLIEEINNTPEAYKPSEIYIDVNGIGRGIYDRLNEYGLPVFPVVSHEASPTKDRYHKLRDELWWRGREWFQQEVYIPNDQELITELTTVRYKYNEQGKVKIESKESLKRRGYNSPNRADAFLLTLMNNAIPEEWSKKIKQLKSTTQEYDIGWIV